MGTCGQFPWKVFKSVWTGAWRFHCSSGRIMSFSTSNLPSIVLYFVLHLHRNVKSCSSAFYLKSLAQKVNNKNSNYCAKKIQTKTPEQSMWIMPEIYVCLMHIIYSHKRIWWKFDTNYQGILLCSIYLLPCESHMYVKKSGSAFFVQNKKCARTISYIDS